MTETRNIYNISFGNLMGREHSEGLRVYGKINFILWKKLESVVSIHLAQDKYVVIVTLHASNTSVNFYQATWRAIPEDSHLHTGHRENLKSHRALYLFADLLGYGVL
jgi:hypothetical protein